MKQPPVDLSTVPDTELFAEVGRRRGAKRQAKAGRKPVLRPCRFCGQEFGFAEMRRHLPICRRAQQPS